MTTLRETGLYDKWGDVGLSIAYKLYVSKDDIAINEEVDDQLDLNEFKITLGPFAVGVFLAILAFIFESLLIY